MKLVEPDYAELEQRVLAYLDNATLKSQLKSLGAMVVQETPDCLYIEVPESSAAVVHELIRAALTATHPPLALPSSPSE